MKLRFHVVSSGGGLIAPRGPTKPDGRLPIGFRYAWDPAAGAWLIQRFRPSWRTRRRAFDNAPPSR